MMTEKKIISATKQLLADNPKLGGIYMATAASAIACEYIEKTDKKISPLSLPTF